MRDIDRPDADMAAGKIWWPPKETVFNRSKLV